MKSTYRPANVIDDHRPMISWGAIFAGAFVAFIVNVGLLSLGSGIGFTSFDPANDGIGRGTLILAGVFTVVAALISFFGGAYVSAKMAGYRVRSVSALHGLSSWAVVSTITVLLVGMGVSKIAGAAFGLVSEGVRGAVYVGASAADSAVRASGDIDTKALGQRVKSTLQKSGVDTQAVERQAKALPQEMAREQARGGDGTEPLQREAQKVGNAFNEDAVAGVLAQKLGISKNEAKSLIAQGQDKADGVLSQLSERGKEVGVQAAQATSEAAGKASLLTFLILLLGAAAAISGGLAGGPRKEFA